ncbi:hypothetical protein ELS17_14965 [Natrinema altunense]|uniref:Uncharacterized protein n=1 Tax=Natrinema altunense TaxID=222984 RepID=A0A482Y3C2_9EURY|nr:hypothetical protein ELS17_14965 [Natrinema altunense]
MTRNTILTLVLAASLLMVGFAGTAAAGGTSVASDDDQVAAAAVLQNQEVSQVNNIDQDANQTADQEATGLGVEISESFNEDNEFPIFDRQATSQGLADSSNGMENGDGFNLEIGTTGDQTIEQNISQTAEASNTNSQTGSASAVNYDF